MCSTTHCTGWDRCRRKISRSVCSSAVRFVNLGAYCGRHRPARLRTRRKSKPRNPKLSPRVRSTVRLFSSLICTCSLANSSRNRLSTAFSNQLCRGSAWIKMTRSSAYLAYATAVNLPRRVRSFARSSIWSTSLRYRLLRTGEITPLTQKITSVIRRRPTPG